jgi:hypothetical protein
MTMDEFKALFADKEYQNGLASVSDLELTLNGMGSDITAIKEWPVREYFYTTLAAAMETVDRKKILSTSDFRTIMKIMGATEDEINGLIDPTFYGSMTVTDLRLSLIKLSSDYVEPDTEAPVITILGDNPVLVEQGTVYTDDGATAEDNIDGDITGDIVTDNQVDTTYAGTYGVYYTVKDSAGNSADAKRTVRVYSTK